MAPTMLALRGATTLDLDDADHLRERVVTLLETIFERNDLTHDAVVSILFTATPDVHSAFPAAAARTIGLGDVPLMCAQELDIDGGMPLCIRVLLHLWSDKPRGELRHVYLEGARSLRDDLPE